MLHLGLLLHFYQPPTQDLEVTKKICQECYEKVIGLLEKYPTAKVTINWALSLSEQIAELAAVDSQIKAMEIFRRWDRLCRRGQVELVGSAAYHPILPKLSDRDIVRQIKLYRSNSGRFLGRGRRQRGFFPPEMAIDWRVLEKIVELGYKWVIVDDSGVDLSDYFGQRYWQAVYRVKGMKLGVFWRNNYLSNKIAFGQIRTVTGLMRKLGRTRRSYLVLAMDGETFGHHQPKQLKFLEELFKKNWGKERKYRLVCLSEIARLYRRQETIEVGRSTWGFVDRFEESWGRELLVWPRWDNPRNPVQQKLWELLGMATVAVGGKESEARRLLDRAGCSDTFWWASGRRFWYPKLVLRGAELMLKAVKASRARKGTKQKAVRIYKEIEAMMAKKKVALAKL